MKNRRKDKAHSKSMNHQSCRCDRYPLPASPSTHEQHVVYIWLLWPRCERALAILGFSHRLPRLTPTRDAARNKHGIERYALTFISNVLQLCSGPVEQYHLALIK